MMFGILYCKHFRNKKTESVHYYCNFIEVFLTQKLGKVNKDDVTILGGA